MKKRMLSLILAAFMLTSLFGAAYAADALTLEVNGKNIALDAAQTPYLQDGAVMAPLEALLDALGGRIAVTDPENSAMTIVVGSKMMNLVIGGKVYVTANLLQVGDKYTYDEPVKGEFSVAVTEKDAVVFIPLDDFCAIFGVESKTEGNAITLTLDIPQEPDATATPAPSATATAEPTPTPTLSTEAPTAAPGATPAPVPEEISVYIDGEKIEFDVPPMLINDRTMVPIRYISEALGAVVDWNEELQEVTITKDGVVNQLILGDPSARKTADGAETEITLETAPFTTNDRTMVPLRYISESFGMEVQWVDDTQTVLITTPTPAPSPSLTPEATASPSPAASYFEESEKKVLDFAGDDTKKALHQAVRKQFEQTGLPAALFKDEDGFTKALTGGKEAFTKAVEAVWDAALKAEKADAEKDGLSLEGSYEVLVTAISDEEGTYFALLDGADIGMDALSPYLGVIYQKDAGLYFAYLAPSEKSSGFDVIVQNKDGRVGNMVLSFENPNRNTFVSTSLLTILLSNVGSE